MRETPACKDTFLLQSAKLPFWASHGRARSHAHDQHQSPSLGPCLCSGDHTPPFCHFHVCTHRIPLCEPNSVGRLSTPKARSRS